MPFGGSHAATEALDAREANKKVTTAFRRFACCDLAGETIAVGGGLVTTAFRRFACCDLE